MSGDMNLEARLFEGLRALEAGQPAEGLIGENDLAYLVSGGYVEETTEGFGFWKKQGYRITAPGRDYMGQLSSLSKQAPPPADTEGAVSDLYGAGAFGTPERERFVDMS